MYTLLIANESQLAIMYKLPCAYCIRTVYDGRCSLYRENTFHRIHYVQSMHTAIYSRVHILSIYIL
jgi:hypothetical protein